MKKFDIVIVGGGLVGLATACALRHSGLKIALVESKLQPLDKLIVNDDIGVRASAINGASQHYFDAIGIWQELYSSGRVAPFSAIKVWEKNGKAQLSANCRDYGYPNLGYIIENDVMQRYLYQQLLSAANIEIFNETCLNSSFENEHAFLWLSNNIILQAKLILGADGARSWLRQQENIGLIERDYRHHALITTVTTEFPHQACAKQLFYADGIVAFLPLYEPHTSCLVWSSYPMHAKELATISPEQFSAQLFSLTGDNVGSCQLINARQLFPLKARLARQFVKHRLVLIGDAAHTIHPLAGQGANLGLQDSALLVDRLKQISQSGQDIGLSVHLKSFQCTRRKDTLMMMTAMRTIQDMFAGQNALKKLLRATGMNAIDHFAPLKKQLIKYAMNI